MSQQIQRDHLQKLSRDGIVVIEEYYNENDCDEAREAINKILEEDRFPSRDEWDGDDIFGTDDTIINRREGADDGMIDIFNLDNAVDLAAKFKDDEFVRDLVDEAASKNHAVQSVNAYVNEDVTSTRDYHADTYGNKFKAFLYLTDVPTTDYGPYSFIKGSHEHSLLNKHASRMINRIRDKPTTNAVFYDNEDVITCTAPKGTLIISNQSGFHRGIPQAPGHKRMLLNLHLTPKQELEQ